MLGRRGDREARAVGLATCKYRELVIMGYRGPVVEGHHSLTSCPTILPTIAHHYYNVQHNNPNPFTSVLKSNT